MAMLIALGTAGQCAITQMAVQTIDGFGKPTASFSEGGQIGLGISFYNNNANVGRVYFEFYIYEPSDTQKQHPVFTHLGNSAPGGAGNKSFSLKVPVNLFYTKPGFYIFQGVAKADTETVTDYRRFRILPGVIDLFYPPNAMKDVADNPLVFRWYSSGADKYRILFDDNSGFMNPIWSTETDQASVEYPAFPADPRQKLSSGIVYWWKVEGLDAFGNKILDSRAPFSFTLKEAIASDVLVERIGMLIDSEKEEIFIFADVKNAGGKAEYNIPLSVYFNGEQVGSAKTIDVIQVNETKRVTFDCSSKAMQLLGAKEAINVVISGMINFADDSQKNNLLTAALKIELEKAKIIGRITDSESPPMGVEGVSVFYSGPVSGEVKTNNGGHYKIENLPLGEYTIRTVKEGFEVPSSLLIRLEKRKACTGNNVVLVKLGEEAVLLIADPSYSPADPYLGESITVQVRIKDSKGIDKVEILYQLPGEEGARTIEMNRVSGDQKEGVYEATIKQ